MRIWRILFPDSWRRQRPADSLGVADELAYEARVASDAIRFAIKQLERELPDEARQDTALLLLDALDRLARAQRHFRIGRVAIDGARPLSSELSAMKDALKLTNPFPKHYFSSRAHESPRCAWIGQAGEVIPCVLLHSNPPWTATSRCARPVALLRPAPHRKRSSASVIDQREDGLQLHRRA